ncbi:MAG: hypothetical protein QGG64_15750 [Candidatus Latescibacteria bacterium]|nr:hypothetical protein [Candidatus Latescibacterota bacterium]
MAIQDDYTKQILEKVRKLPSEKIVEILDFVTFMEEQKNLRAREDALEVSDHEFETLLDDCFGHWKDEVDGIKYTNRLRNTWQDQFGGTD